MWFEMIVTGYEEPYKELTKIKSQGLITEFVSNPEKQTKHNILI